MNNSGVGIFAVAAVLILLCGLTAPAWLPQSRGGDAASPSSAPPPSSGIGDFIRGLFAPSPEQEARAEQIRQFTSLSLTATWEAMHPTPTPTPQPGLTTTVKTGTQVVNEIFLSVFVAGIVIVAIVGLYRVTGILERKANTYQERATGATILLADGSLAMTEKAVGPTITPRPIPFLARVRQLFRFVGTGKVEPIPVEKPLLNDAGATPEQYTEVATTAVKADAFAAAMSSEISEQERLDRMGTLKGNFGVTKDSPLLAASTYRPTKENILGWPGQVVRDVVLQLGAGTPDPWKVSATEGEVVTQDVSNAT